MGRALGRLTRVARWVESGSFGWVRDCASLGWVGLMWAEPGLPNQPTHYYSLCFKTSVKSTSLVATKSPTQSGPNSFILGYYAVINSGDVFRARASILRDQEDDIRLAPLSQSRDNPVNSVSPKLAAFLVELLC
ncbi:hypothetical protein L873DRAFT_1755595 [Choiromyces venosus 120613-1]|uniref:Uncharacterized protein n=1 Tax=Choiromyces venosus 120613-1 TaxID=1336337 RepID=A0A3N4ITF6_9PEZI|nr:hypothetical protein L873DRAFT_1755595 [Choiromyces venosus 120613-1]